MQVEKEHGQEGGAMLVVGGQQVNHLSHQALSLEPRKEKTNALQVPLPRRLSWPCVSDLH